MTLERDPLAITPEEMRRTGYATVDALVELLSAPAPVLRRAGRVEMNELLGGPQPEEGEGYDSVLAGVVRDVLPYSSRGDHPGYFAYIPGCGTWPAALGDLIASAMNLYCGSWLESAGPTGVELQVLDWFRQWIGYPEQADGILVSGGSAANLTALACAREVRLGAMSDGVVAYCSDQAHSSIARAARTLGFRPDQLHVLPTDAAYRMRVDALAAAMDADTGAGRLPLFVCASAGSTNTGAVDPLPELASLCRERGVWLHVDAAYGGFVALTARGRAALAGVEQADSVTLDPHKWLYQPFECGALLVRERGMLERAFAVSPDYLADSVAGTEEVNFSDRGLQLSRGSRALKVWMSLRTFGIAAFRTAVDRCLDLAVVAQEVIENDDRLELMLPATLGIVCFRRRVPGVESESEIARINTALAAELEASGRGLVSSTRLRGRFALRMCVLNHTSSERDVRAVLEYLAATSPPRESVPAREQYDRERGRTLAQAPGSPHETLWKIPVLAGLTAAGRRLVRDRGHELSLAAGASAVRRWAADRDFYVVLDGELVVDLDGETVRSLHRGDFFGELAAKDWGSGFGYPRLATVTAVTPVRLWVLPPETFGALMETEPTLAATVDDAIRERLPVS